MGHDVVLVEYSPLGDYARKINTIVQLTNERYIFLGASDLLFRPAWFENAVAHMEPGVGVIGTNDLGSQRVMDGNHSTHSLVTREYVEKFGTIDERGKVLCELYWHEFVDDEFIETAQHRDAFVAATDSIVEHMHPNWGKGMLGSVESDPVYAAQQTRMVRSHRTFQRRRRLWM